MPEDIFEHPRLLAIHDALHPDRGDLDVYVDVAAELGRTLRYVIGDTGRRLRRSPCTPPAPRSSLPRMAPVSGSPGPEC
jgi:hypothetical protein